MAKRIANVAVLSAAWALGLACILAPAGCGGGANELDATLQGTVAVAGELAERGSVAFHPVDKGPIAVGTIFADGSYTVRVGQGNLNDPDGGKLRSGEYVATVVVEGPTSGDDVVAEGGPPLAGPRLSAQKYADKATSDLKFTITPGRNVIALMLDSAASDGPLEGGPLEGGPLDGGPTETASPPASSAADATPTGDPASNTTSPSESTGSGPADPADDEDDAAKPEGGAPNAASTPSPETTPTNPSPN